MFPRLIELALGICLIRCLRGSLRSCWTTLKRVDKPPPFLRKLHLLQFWWTMHRSIACYVILIVFCLEWWDAFWLQARGDALHTISVWNGSAVPSCSWVPLYMLWLGGNREFFFSWVNNGDRSWLYCWASNLSCIFIFFNSWGNITSFLQIHSLFIFLQLRPFKSISVCGPQYYMILKNYQIGS